MIAFSFLKKYITAFVSIAIIASLMAPVSVFAAPGINKELPYQGTLKTSAGANVSDGSYDMVFKIYDAVSGGNTLWTGTHTSANGNAVSVASGLFRALLGSGTGNTMTLDFNSDAYYLGLTIASDSEMTPRQRIGAAGYAFNADTVDGIGFSTSTLTVGDIFYADSSNTLQRLGVGNNGQVLKLSSGIPSWGADIQGPSQANIWATTTDSLLAYLVDTSNVVTIGTNATTTTGNILEVVGNSLFGGNGIFSGLFTAYNTITAPIFTATSTTLASTFPYASTTALTVSGQSWLTGLTTLGNASTTQLTVTGLSYFNSSTTFNGVEMLFPNATGTANQILTTDGAGGLSWTTVTSSAGGYFSTTTDSLAIYPTNTSYVTVLGGSATTTTGNILEVIGSSLFDSINASSTLIVDGHSIFTTASSTDQTLSGYLVVSGQTTLGNATSTQLTNSGLSWFTGTTTLGIASVTDSVVLASTTPAITLNALYNLAGVLYWNGSDISTASTNNWTFATNYATTTLTATSTMPWWSQGALYASSTLNVSGLATLGNASSTQLTVSGPSWFTGLATLGNASSTQFTNSGLSWFNATSTFASNIISNSGINIASSSPATTTQNLYALGSTLYWNGVEVGSGGSNEWTFAQNYGTTTLTATSTIPWWSQGALYASSTLQVAGLTILNNASTTLLTNSGLAWFTGTTTLGIANVTNSMIFDSNAPDVTTNALYNNAGALMWNGKAVSGGSAGVVWSAGTSAVDNGWRSVTYGNGLFVAVSTTGTGDRVMTSPDGITWTSRTSAADNDWRSVTYGNGLFVAVSNTGTGDRVMTSPDGITWTSRTSAADNNWILVTYGNGLFVAVSNTGTGDRVMTSPDGITWTSRSSAADNDWTSVVYGNGLFVAVSETGTGNRVMTSPDGITWTSRSSASDNGWRFVAYGNGLFVAVSYSGTGDRVMTSPDGIIWTSRTSVADNSWRSVAYGNGLFVAVSDTGTGNRVMTSPDGITWTARSSATDNSWLSVAYGNGLFVAVSYSGTGDRVMTSGTFGTGGGGVAADSLNFTHFGDALVLDADTTIDSTVNTLTFNGGLLLASSTPATTTLALYNLGSTLFWNGTEVGTGSGGAFLTGAGTTTLATLSDNVGIGTTSPAYLLDLYATTTRNLFRIGTTTAPSILVLSSNGFLGLGLSNPTTLFDIYSSAASTTAIATFANTESSFSIFGTNANPSNVLTAATGTLAIDSTNGKLYVNAGGTTWADQSSASLAAVGISATTTLAAQTSYQVDTTSSGIITGTLPTGASSGDVVQVIDTKGNFAASNFLVLPGGSDTIEGSTATTTLSTSNTVTTFIYDSINSRWTIQGDNEEASTVLHRVRMRRAAAQSITATTNVQIQYDTEDYDIGGIGNTSTGIVTISQAGTYRITSGWADTTVTNNIQTQIEVNGIQVSRAMDTQASAGSLDGINTTITLELAADDTVEGLVYSGVGNTTDTSLEDQPFLEVIQLPTAVITTTVNVQAAEYMYRTAVNVAENTNIADNGTISVDTLQTSSGSSISYNTTSNQFTLTAGKTYRLFANPSYIGATFIRTELYDVTNNARIGVVSQIDNASGADGTVMAIITPSTDILVEWRNVSGIAKTIGSDAESLLPQIIIETIADGTMVAQFGGATASSAGTTGFIGAPSAGEQGSVLLGSGAWSATSTLFVDATNNRFGIGTTSPFTTLGVSGDSYFTATSTFAKGISLASSTPDIAANTLYNNGGILYWNGSTVGGVSGGAEGQSLVFDSTGSAVATSTLFISSSGNVGIGTTTPVAASGGTAKLHIVGSNSGNHISNVIENTDGGSASVASIQLKTATSTNYWQWFARNGDMFAGIANVADYMTIKDGGNVGIGDTSPDYALDVYGTICQDTNSDDICDGAVTSDERLKKNIVVIDNALDKVAQLRGVYFEWDKTNPHTEFLGEGRQTGLIAQEVEVLFPELVYEDMAGYKMLDYQKLTALNLQAIKEQQEMLNPLYTGIAIDLTFASSSLAFMSIDENGNIGIGTSTPAYKLHVEGNVAATGFVNLSTEEAKENIEYLTKGDYEALLESIKTTDIASYEYIDDETNEERLGLIAENAPETVLSLDGKGVDLYKMTSLVFGAVKAQQAQIEELFTLSKVEVQATAPSTNIQDTIDLENLTVANAEFTGNIIVRGHTTFGEDTVGQAKILAGNTSASVVFTKEYQYQPIITATPIGIHPIDFGITDTTTAGFTIQIDPIQTADITFNWHAFATTNSTNTNSEVKPNPSIDTNTDIESPVITINGNNPAEIELNSTYNDLGATVTDNVNENLGIKTFLDGVEVNQIQLDTSTSTTYIITYKATDQAGNTGTAERTVIVGNSEVEPQDSDTATTTPEIIEPVEEEVIDTTVPIITLTGDETINLTVGDTYTEQGATAQDDTDGDITQNIITNNPIDTTTAGEYTVTYNVTDQAGNNAIEVTRIIIVTEPIIITPEPVTATTTATNTQEE